MNQIIFTPYVADLCADRSPIDERHREIQQALERRIRRELMKRSLWSMPPSYLGFYGDPNWFRKPRGPLEELTAECYGAIFLERLDRLCAHLKIKTNVDGLVHLAVRNFIHDLQQRHDPLGTRIYHLIHGTVRDLLETGDLWVVDGPERVSNSTLLAFSAKEAKPADETTLHEQVALWCEEMMPALVTTRGRGLSRLKEDIKARILSLPTASISGFRFRHLVQSFKQIARGRWDSALETEGRKGGGEGPPHYTFEDRQSFRHLLDCVERELEALEEAGEEKRLADLRAVWDLLVAWAADHPEVADPPLNPERTPSRRQISKVLDLPRDRLSPLYDKLGALIRECHAPGAAMGKEATVEKDRRKSRRQAGALYVIRAAPAWEGEWVVLEPAQGGAWWVAPVDDHPLAGPEDLRLGHRTVRCGFALTVPDALLENDLFVESLTEDDSERLQGHHRATLEGTLHPTLRQQEAEWAPDYQDWMDEGPRAAHEAVQQAARFAGGRQESVGPPAPQRPTGRWSLVAAALFAVLSAALSYQLWQTQQRLAAADAPRVASEPVNLNIGVAPRSSQRWILQPEEEALMVEMLVRKKPGCRGYTVELVTKNGRTLWRTEEIHPDKTNRFILSRDFLARKPTLLNLHARCRGERELLEEVELAVVLVE